MHFVELQREYSGRKGASIRHITPGIESRFNVTPDNCQDILRHLEPCIHKEDAEISGNTEAIQGKFRKGMKECFLYLKKWMEA